MIENEEKIRNLENRMRRSSNIKRESNSLKMGSNGKNNSNGSNSGKYLLIEKPLSKKIRNENSKDNMIQTKLNGKVLQEDQIQKDNSSNEQIKEFTQINCQKITDFFKVHESTQKKKIEALPIIQEEPIKNKNSDIKNLIVKKDIELTNLTQENYKLKEVIKNNQMEFNNQQNKIICNLLVEREEQNRIEMRNTLKIQSQSIGEITLVRQGSKYTEVWIDGLEFKQTKQQLQKNKYETEIIQEKLKTLKPKKNQTENLESYQDLKDNLKLSLKILEKEEILYKENLKRLNSQKEKIYRTQKKMSEENNCYFNQKGDKGRWPLLNDRYQVLQLIGKGGYSEVYKGFDVQTNTLIALKLHHIERAWSQIQIENYIKHVVRENDSHKLINHNNIVKLIDNLEIDQDTMITILEYCDGGDLSTYLKTYGPLQEKEAKTMIKIILNGLKCLHEHPLKIIHYDLKPQNIMFHEREIKIGDFGLCKIMSDQENTKIELTSQGVGTYWYLPPECFQNSSESKISSKVDIWSIGVIFFEMLYGQKPFGHNLSQAQIIQDNLILQCRSVQFPSKPQVSKEAQDFIKNCLLYDQDQRFDVKQALKCCYIQKK